MMVAPSATMQAGSSDAGSAWARLPPIVPAIADRRMGDMSNRVRQQRCMRGDFGRFLQIDMARQRTDGEDVTPHRDPAQLGEFADIDDQFGRDQPQIHRRHQALAA